MQTAYPLTTLSPPSPPAVSQATYLLKLHQLPILLHPCPAAVVAAAFFVCGKLLADDAAAECPDDIVHPQQAIIVNTHQCSALQLSQCCPSCTIPPGIPDLLSCMAAPALIDTDNVQEDLADWLCEAIEAAAQHPLQPTLSCCVSKLCTLFDYFPHTLHGERLLDKQVIRIAGKQTKGSMHNIRARVAVSVG